MKRLKGGKLLVLISLLCLGMSACQNDVDDSGKIPITFTGQIDAMSRGTDLNQQASKLVEGRQVGLTILHAENAHANGAWKVGPNGKLINQGENVYWGNEEIAVYGYHPYQQGWSDLKTDYSFSVQTDQSTDEGYLNSDLLWVSATGEPYAMSVQLMFRHKLAKINIILSSNEIDDLSGATIWVCGTKITALFNPETGTLSSDSDAQVKDIKAGVTTKDFLTSSCVIVPQTVESGTPFVKLEHQDKIYTYHLPKTIDFASEKVYKFSLEIQDGELGDVTGSASDIPWGD